jgi:hypothetical protein
VVKHLAGTERFWFSIDFANLDVTWPWTDDDVHSNFRIAPGDTVARIVADYVEECANSRRATVDADLDDSARGEGMDFTLALRDASHDPGDCTALRSSRPVA